MVNRGETMLPRSKALSGHRPIRMGTAFLMRRISVRTRLHREQATAVRSSSFLLQDLLQGRECGVGKCALQKGRWITTPLHSCSLLQKKTARSHDRDSAFFSEQPKVVGLLTKNCRPSTKNAKFQPSINSFL